MKKQFKIVLFAYNFPHRKTIDFIDKIYDSGFMISLILAADFIKIKSPKSLFNLYKHLPSVSIEQKACQYKIPLCVVQHNSTESQQLIKKHGVNFGIISGARILSQSIIKSIKYGVLNLHPGLLPKIRGLDSVLWSIYKNCPIGVTAHLINHNIDAGYLVIKKKINITGNDSLQSLYEKNYQLQLYLIPISLNLILENKNFKNLSLGSYNSKMNYKTQLELNNKISAYIHKHAKINES